MFASDFLGKANLISGKLTNEGGKWYIAGDGFRIPVNYVGGQEGDDIKAAVRGEYFEFCSADDEDANPYHLTTRIFTGLAWRLVGTMGGQPLDISALGNHASTLSDDSDVYVRIRPENVVYYNV